ncbi:MAG: Mov34/MPN/PAD-1 family protein [Thermoplasmata archaeon]|nr:MAG: Mov34/MPN/PAD-1 family protein [Thermoplasmata archaeon]
MPKAKKMKLKKKKLKMKVSRKTKEEPSKPEEGKVKEEERGETKKETEEKEEAPEEKKEFVNFNYKALSKVLRHGMRFSNNNIPREKWVECMGFLVGNVNGNDVEIKDAIPMVHGNLVEVEFQDEHYAKADEINQSLTDENWVVGWYHTHPGHGLFLSAVDKINHSGYQSLNNKAIALVFDPSKFNSKNKLGEYIKIFRLNDPELREKSDFIEVEDVKVKQSFEEVVDSVYESTMLNSKDKPLILEYKEEYKKPETDSAKEGKKVEKDLKEIQKMIENMQKEIKLLNNKLEKHMAATNKAVEELRKKKAKKDKKGKKHKKTRTCEYCGYDSVTYGDKICGNCGMKL